MPMKKGSDRKTVSGNISEMMASGHDQKQAVAASLENARRHPSRKSGHNAGRKTKRSSKRA